jgi:Ca2+-binding EF-hand superfamily protein
MFSEIELFRRCEDLRIDLARRHDFSTYACFRAVDDRSEGDVNPDNIRSFIKNNGYYPSEDEVIAVVRRLDVDADCKINYAEFCEAIKTNEFSRAPTNH